MIVRTMDDMRAAFDRMAKHNRLSLTALNDMAAVGAGVLTRFRRKEAPSKHSTRGDTKGTLTPTDLKLSTMLAIIEAAGFEIEIRPRVQDTRRRRVLDAARNTEDTGDSKEE